MFLFLCNCGSNSRGFFWWGDFFSSTSNVTQSKGRGLMRQMDFPTNFFFTTTFFLPYKRAEKNYLKREDDVALLAAIPQVNIINNCGRWYPIYHLDTYQYKKTNH